MKGHYHHNSIMILWFLSARLYRPILTPLFLWVYVFFQTLQDAREGGAIAFV
jgi:hypothetical protein